MRDQNKDERILRKQDVVMDWIHLAHDRVQWFCVVNTVINFTLS